MRKSIVFKFLYLIIFLAPQLGMAQSKSPDSPKRTTINFEDQLIKGQNQKPDLLYLLQKKQFNYKRLIRLREDFLPEMRESAIEIQEGRRIQLKQPNKE
jgi:hypothetical protein